MEFMNKKTLLVVFIIAALLATTAFARIGEGKYGIMLPTKPGQNSEVLPIDKKQLRALQAGEITMNDILLAKTNGILDTLLTPAANEVRFGATPGDTMLSYFKPPAALIVKEIGMIFTDINESKDCHVINLSLAYANWHAENHPSDSVDAKGWLGAFIDNVWTPSSFGVYPIQWEAGHLPLWGEFPVTVTNTSQWVPVPMIYMGYEPNVARNDFLAIMVPVGAAGGWIRWEAGQTTQRQWYGLKSYAAPGTSGNPGWHVRSYSWLVYALVEFYENTPPSVKNGGPYGSVLNADARTVSCHVTDIDANDPNQAGAATVNLFYKVNDAADYTMTACTLASGTDTDGIWNGVIPAGILTPGDVVHFYFEATDKAGLATSGVELSYGYFAKVNDILVFYNDDGTSYPSWILSPYYDNLWVNESDTVAYPYDVWVGLADGALSSPLVNMYNYMVEIDAYSPATMNDDVLGAWFASGPKFMFWSSQEWGYQLTGGSDSTFAADDWHNMYMGIGTIGPMDINYDRTHSAKKRFPVNAVAGDIISGPLAAFCGDSLQLYYYSDYELGFGDWADLMTAGDGAVVCFTDSAEGKTMGVHKEAANGTKGVFLTFDQLCLDTWALSSYTVTDGYHWTEPNVHSVAGAALRWFGAPTAVDDNTEPGVIGAYSLNQNYPNPFNPETVINYSISKPGLVKLSVYNVLGQKVADLVNEHKTANTYKVTFDASDLTSGVYFYRLEVGDYSKTMKMMLLR